MPGYQPRNETDPVWFNGNQVNSLTALTAAGGVGVHITAVYGWDDRPDVRDVRENRSGQDGEYADNLYLGGRTITIEGTVQGSTWANLQVRKRALAAIFNPSSTEALLKIPDPATASPTAVYAETGMTGYERCYCRVIEAIQFGEMLDPSSMSFQVILRASDPRIYSDVVTSTDSGTTGTASRTVTVDQTGTYDTPPDLTVTGPTASTFSVSEPSSGLNLSFTGLTVASTETLAINTLDRTINYTSTYEGAHLIRNNIVALWMLDEAAGTTADNKEGTAAYDGTYTGGYTLDQSGPYTGVSSVDLNGSTGYVSVPYNAALFPAGAITFEGWFKLDTLAATMCLVDGITSNLGWRIEINTSGKFVLTVGNGSTTANKTVTYFTEYATPVSTGNWYHLQVSMFPGAAQSGYIYLNGDSIGTMGAALIDYSPATSGGFRFGTRLDGSNDLDGKIAAFAIYDTIYNGSYYQAADGATVSAYNVLDATTAQWAPLGTASSVYTLASSGLNTGSKLNVSYRDARL